MAFVSVLQVVKVNDLKSGIKEGRAWELQDAECIGLAADGAPEWVGVLPIPKDMRGKVAAGLYSASFALRPNLSTRRIEAVLTALTPIPAGAQKRAS